MLRGAEKEVKKKFHKFKTLIELIIQEYFLKFY